MIQLERLLDELYGLAGRLEDITVTDVAYDSTTRKLTLTIREAAEYSNIGINKIDAMLKQPNCPFVLFVGNKKLVKRREFEEFIHSQLTI